MQSDADADVLQSDRLSTNKRSLDDWIVEEVLRHVYKLQKFISNSGCANSVKDE